MTVFASVPVDARLIADLPEWCLGALVFMDDGWHERHANGLPRSVRDLLGRVKNAAWLNDSVVELDVTWHPSYEDLADALALTLVVAADVEHVEVIANAVT